MSTTIRAVEKGEHNHQVDVIGVDERGVFILVGGRKDAIGWCTLQAACSQDDAALAEMHRRISVAATEWQRRDKERRVADAIRAVREGVARGRVRRGPRVVVSRARRRRDPPELGMRNRRSAGDRRADQGTPPSGQNRAPPMLRGDET
jgi:hypothetical protein